MSSDFPKVAQALAEGASPAMLCATCPWDRHCLTPPSMSKADIDAEVQKAEAKDLERARQAETEGKTPGMPIGMLLMSVMFSGKDTSATICPVFALRLRSSSGKTIADSIRNEMQKWDDAQ